MNAIGDYRAALRDYFGKRDQAAAMFKFITTVAESISYREVAFLAHFFGVSAPPDLQMDVRNEAKNHRYDLTKWPSYDDMLTTVKSWHASFIALNDAWHQIPENERFGLQVPPKVMRTS
jgi:hypothetical protein